MGDSPLTVPIDSNILRVMLSTAMTTQILFPFAERQLALPFEAPAAPIPRGPVWPPMPLRAALTPPALPRCRRARPEPVPAFQVVYLVGCGKTKQSRRARAAELYTGNLFRACRAHAEKNATTWRILSGRYGTVRPETVIEPYDAKPPRRELERAQWVTSTVNGLTSDPSLRSGFRVVCLAGAEYAAPICAELERRGIECSQPLAGLGVGARLGWLKRNEVTP